MTEPIPTLECFRNKYLNGYRNDADMWDRIVKIRDAFSRPLSSRRNDQSEEDFAETEKKRDQLRKKFLSQSIKKSLETDDLNKASRNFWLLWLINPLEAASLFPYVSNKMPLEYHYLIKYNVIFDLGRYNSKILNYPNNYAVLLIAAMFHGEFCIENLATIYDAQLNSIYEWDRSCNSTPGQRKVFTRSNLIFIMDKIAPYYRVYILCFFYSKYYKYAIRCKQYNKMIEQSARNKVQIILDYLKNDSVCPYERLKHADHSNLSHYDYDKYEELKKYALELNDTETLKVVFGDNFPAPSNIS